MNNLHKYNQLRQQYPEFCYESFSYTITDEGLSLNFTFSAGNDILFQPTSFIPKRNFIHFENLSTEQYNQLVFQIGMIELISYWKCVCSPKVVINPYTLDGDSIQFWKKLYFNGLGEFFYINGIESTVDDFMEVECSGNSELPPANFSTDSQKFLVPIGGGKDSVVTLETLKKANIDIRPLIINPRGATIQCAEKAGFALEDVLVIKRQIDPTLLKLNAQGFLNGHTPFSAMLAFYSILASAITGIANIALSNENSANETTVIGSSVNHQYSKSLEFEDDFRSYVAKHVTNNSNYFSFLRPLSELQIAMLFAQNPKYFDVFKSCNAGSKEDIWCGKCAKCLFAFIILSPFIPPETLEKIFGKNLLNDPDLENYLEELSGKQPTKPFECVGTIDEVNTALKMAANRYYKNKELPILLRKPIPKCDIVPLNSFLNEHNLNEKLQKILQEEIMQVCKQYL